jgi:hypothetical protein
MDTRFWGPSGWRLLHLITFTYNPLTQKKSVKELLTVLPFVLPCKFCRASLTDHYRAEPFESELESKEKLQKWLYRVHNLVNEKLRGQGINEKQNPSFSSVKKIYQERISAGCTRTEFEGWDFLFSIADTQNKKESPIPKPEEYIYKSKDPAIRNRWNLLKPTERFPYYSRFWKVIGDCLPFSEWRDAWHSCSPDYSLLSSRKKWFKHLWKIRICLEEKLELVNQEKFESLCKRIEMYKSGCRNTRKKSMKTCRRLKATRKTNKV